MGTEPDSSDLHVDGLAHGYVSLEGIRPYEGTILELGALTESSRSEDFEIVSLDVWPLLGLGVGLAGARVQLLILDMGVGTLSYNPQPPPRRAEAEAEVDVEEQTNDVEVLEEQNGRGSGSPRTIDEREAS